MKVKMLLYTGLCLLSSLAKAEWVDFEDLYVGKEFDYKPYYSLEYEFKASRYFKGGTLIYYDFKIAANLGDSNNSENYLSIDTGNNSCLSGISVKHKEQQPFDFHAFDIGKIYEHDGEFNVSLLALDKEGKVLVEELLTISEPLTRIELQDKFTNIHELLINPVYVDDIDNSVSRFAVDNIDISVTGSYRKAPIKGRDNSVKLSMIK